MPKTRQKLIEAPPTNGHVMLGIMVVAGSILTVMGGYEVALWIASHTLQIYEGAFVLVVLGFLVMMAKTPSVKRRKK